MVGQKRACKLLQLERGFRARQLESSCHRRHHHHQNRYTYFVTFASLNLGAFVVVVGFSCHWLVSGVMVIAIAMPIGGRGDCAAHSAYAAHCRRLVVGVVASYFSHSSFEGLYLLQWQQIQTLAIDLSINRQSIFSTPTYWQMKLFPSIQMAR